MLGGCSVMNAEPPITYPTPGGSVAVRTSHTASPIVSAPSGVTFAGEPATAMDPTGRLYVVIRDSSNLFWISSFFAGTWQPWVSTGGFAQGTAAVCIGTDGAAYIAIRAFDNSYFMARYSPASGMIGWYQMAGLTTFGFDPVMVGPAENGVMYLVGARSASPSIGVHLGTFVPNPSFWSSGFEGWSYVGGDPIDAKPGLALGTDGRAYMVYKYPNDGSYFAGTSWMVKFSRYYAEGWYLSPMPGSVDSPTVAVSAYNVVYAANRDAGGRPNYVTASQGTGNTWLGWADPGGPALIRWTSASAAMVSTSPVAPSPAFTGGRRATSTGSPGIPTPFRLRAGSPPAPIPT